MHSVHLSTGGGAGAPVAFSSYMLPSSIRPGGGAEVLSPFFLIIFKIQVIIHFYSVTMIVCKKKLSVITLGTRLFHWTVCVCHGHSVPVMDNLCHGLSVSVTDILCLLQKF